MAVTVTPLIATQTIYQATSPNEYLFPGLCRKQNGDYLLIARKASGHLVADGKLVMRTSPTGLTGSWSAETILMSPGNTAAGIPRLLADGRVVIATWYNVGGTTPFIGTTLVSTDATCTSWVRGGDLPLGTSGYGNVIESGIVVMPNGDWLLPTEVPEGDYSRPGGCPFSSALNRSTDEGATWTFERWIKRTSNPAGPYYGTDNYNEPFLFLLDNGELICAIRTSEPGWGDASGRYTHIHRSTDGGVTWVDEGRLNSAHQHASRMPIGQTPGGTVLLHNRLLYMNGGVAWSGRGAYYVSEDRCATWNAGTELDSGTSPPASNPTAPPMYSYGDIVNITGGVAMLWCDETPISGSGPAIQFRTYSITGEPVLEAVGRSLDLLYNISTAVGRSLEIPFNVNTPVGRSLAISYGIAGAIGRSLALPWNVNATVGRSLQISYGIETVGYRTMRLLIPGPAPYATRRTLLDTLTPVGPFTARGTSRRHASAAGSSRGHAQLTGGTTP